MDGNGADYVSEQDFCLRLIKALELIVNVCDKNPVRYPLLIADVVTLLEGRVVEDEEGGQYLINGLRQQIDEMYLTYEALDLEVEYEIPFDPPTYEI